MQNIHEIVKKTAELARLNLSDSEVEVFSKQLENVFSYIEKLQKVNTSGVEPLVAPLVNADGTALRETYLRADELRSNAPEAEMATGSAVVHTAPDHLYNNFKVPQVIAQK